jgi:putative peptidoglycan binding protein
MTGSDVWQLQENLLAIGFPSATQTPGVFSSTNKAEVETFQKRVGLKVTGTVGSATFDMLFAELAQHGIATGTGTGGSTDGGGGLTASASAPSVAKAWIDWSACKTKPQGPLCGLAIPAAGTPAPVVEIIEAGNLIAHNAYAYGGGHHYKFVGENYTQGMDCSGSVSWALHADSITGGDLISSPDDSSGFTSYGWKGTGQWITIYTLPGYHAFMHIAGLWFDTAGPNDWDATKASTGDRWSMTDGTEFTTYTVKAKNGKKKTVPQWNWKIRYPRASWNDPS